MTQTPYWIDFKSDHALQRKIDTGWFTAGPGQGVDISLDGIKDAKPIIRYDSGALDRPGVRLEWSRPNRRRLTAITSL